jgi:hypothetical protein
MGGSSISNAAEDTVGDSCGNRGSDLAQAWAVSSGAVTGVPGVLSAVVSGVGSAVPPQEITGVPSSLSKGLVEVTCTS